jgi:hypothetical protein
VLAEQLLATEEFRTLMHLISRALAIAPVLDGESVAILAKAAGVPDPDQKEAAWCT